VEQADEAVAVQVWPENWPVLELFLAVASQWRHAPFGGPVGLHYTAVDVVIRHLQLDVTPEQWGGLQVMEAAAFDALTKKMSL
jgi:hypothetical protein